MSHESAYSQFARAIPIVRGLLAHPTGDPDMPHEPVILRSLTTHEALEFAASEDKAANGTPLAGLPKSERSPLFLGAVDCDGDVDSLRHELDDAIAAYTAGHNAKPEVLCAQGLGVLYLDQEIGAPHLPLQNRVAMVTGAAGAIGYAVCKALLEAGCYLAATDLPGERLDAFADELAQSANGRVLAVPMDVTDKESVTAAFERIIHTWGGIDIVVVNAGIAMVSHLKDMDLEGFRRLQRVNVDGTLLTLSETARHFIRQGTGGDIVVMSTKNVPCPGAGFGAYSATKAACHQLGRIASLELAEYGVRVNMVAPDAVFSGGQHKSGLWEEVGPGRMRARNLDEKGLQEYYRNRNLLKARVTGRHVANAVLFFVTRQTPTTGATIPVDGGLPDATPR